MKIYPVFIACYATATCSRRFLYKWHRISEDNVLSEKEINFIVALIVGWIKNKC